MAYLSKLEDAKLNQVIDSGAAKLGFAGLESEHEKILTGSVRLMGNISSGSNGHCDYLIENGIVGKMRRLLTV